MASNEPHMLLTPVSLFTLLTTPQMLDTLFVKNKKEKKCEEASKFKVREAIFPRGGISVVYFLWIPYDLCHNVVSIDLYRKEMHCSQLYYVDTLIFDFLCFGHSVFQHFPFKKLPHFSVFLLYFPDLFLRSKTPI